MLVCELRQQNIAVFGRWEGLARFLGAVTGRAGSPLVLVVGCLERAAVPSRVVCKEANGLLALRARTSPALADSRDKNSVLF